MDIKELLIVLLVILIVMLMGQVLREILVAVVDQRENGQVSGQEMNVYKGMMDKVISKHNLLIGVPPKMEIYYPISMEYSPIQQASSIT